jgi:hypothetical protein
LLRIGTFKSARTNTVFPLTSISVIDRILGVVTADACITALLATRPKPLIANLTSSKSTLRNHGLGRIDRLDQR